MTSDELQLDTVALPAARNSQQIDNLEGERLSSKHSSHDESPKTEDEGLDTKDMICLKRNYCAIIVATAKRVALIALLALYSSKRYYLSFHLADKE
jgi:hypothetical protein